MAAKSLTRLLAGLLAAVVLMAALPESAGAASTRYVRVTATSAYIYKKASTGSTRLKKIEQDDVLLCGALSGTWAYVKYSGTVGYVPRSCISTDLTPAAQPSGGDSTIGGTGGTGGSQTTESTASSASVTAYTKQAAKLYKRANTAGGSYGTVAKGKSLTCYKTSGNWAYVKVGNIKGYMLKSALTTAKPSGSSSGTTTTPTTVSSGSGVTCYVKTATPLFASASLGATQIVSLCVGDKILVTHSKASWCRVITTAGKVGYIPYPCVSKTKVYAVGEVQLKDWFTSDIQNLFPVGSTVVVTDVYTRKSFNVYRKGGLVHADCEPLSAADTAVMLGVYGGAWSWDRRPIWVTINGCTYAASMNGMGHGEGEIEDSGFEGHFCIHFVNSRTHGTDKVDADHQAAIQIAYSTKP